MARMEKLSVAGKLNLSSDKSSVPQCTGLDKDENFKNQSFLRISGVLVAFVAVTAWS